MWASICTLALALQMDLESDVVTKVPLTDFKSSGYKFDEAQI